MWLWPIAVSSWTTEPFVASSSAVRSLPRRRPCPRVVEVEGVAELVEAEEQPARPGGVERGADGRGLLVADVLRPLRGIPVGLKLGEHAEVVPDRFEFGVHREQLAGVDAERRPRAGGDPVEVEARRLPPRGLAVAEQVVAGGFHVEREGAGGPVERDHRLGLSRVQALDDFQPAVAHRSPERRLATAEPVQPDLAARPVFRQLVADPEPVRAPRRTEGEARRDGLERQRDRVVLPAPARRPVVGEGRRLDRLPVGRRADPVPHATDALPRVGRVLVPRTVDASDRCRRGDGGKAVVPGVRRRSLGRACRACFGHRRGLRTTRRRRMPRVAHREPGADAEAGECYLIWFYRVSAHGGSWARRAARISGSPTVCDRRSRCCSPGVAGTFAARTEHRRGRCNTGSACGRRSSDLRPPRSPGHLRTDPAASAAPPSAPPSPLPCLARHTRSAPRPGLRSGRRTPSADPRPC